MVRPHDAGKAVVHEMLYDQIVGRIDDPTQNDCRHPRNDAGFDQVVAVLQSPREVVSRYEVGQVRCELIVAVVVEALDTSSSSERTVDLGSFGPVGRSATEVGAFHLATVFWLIP